MKQPCTPYFAGLALALAATGCTRTSISRTGDLPLWFDPDHPGIERHTPAPAITGDWIAVEDDVWIDLLGQTGTLLNTAMNQVKKENWDQAADALTRAGAHLRLEIGRAEGGTGLALHVASAELYQLARRSRERKPVSEDRLRKVFVHAHYALALHHGEKLSGADRTTPGYAHSLKAVALNLAQIAVWKALPDGHPVERAIAGGMSASEYLLKNGAAPPKLDATLDAIDEAISLIGLDLQSEAGDEV